MIFGGIEMGGTKMVCAIGNEKGEILQQTKIDTKGPQETLSELADYFRGKDITALGLASFGPVDLNRDSDTYGYITETPKTEWKNTDVVGFFKKELNIPIGFDTDVNAACIGEVIYGAGKGYKNVIYGTIGTGIGFGVYLQGNLLHGLMHPETGHMLIKKHQSDTFEGCCPYHKSCFEGLASGPAIAKRWGKQAEELTNKKEVWELEAYYIAEGLHNCIMCYSPELIILGGGVMHNSNLYPLIRKNVLESLNNYISKKEIFSIDQYIVMPKLNDKQGIIGACELGRQEYLRDTSISK